MSRLFFLSLISFSIFSVPALAKDERVSATELRKLIVGKTIISGGAKLRYGKDGSYSYNGMYPGRYEIMDGRICVDFDSGQSRCDTIVKNGGKYFLINGQGKRFSFGN